MNLWLRRDTYRYRRRISEKFFLHILLEHQFVRVEVQRRGARAFSVSVSLSSLKTRVKRKKEENSLYETSIKYIAISSPSAPAHFFCQRLTKKCAGAEGEEIAMS